MENKITDNTVNTSRRPFMAFTYGTVADSKLGKTDYAVHVEGNLCREPVYFDAVDGKPSSLNFSMALGRNPWILFGPDVAETEKDNPNINDERPFVEVVIFGNLADKMKDKLKKGSKVACCGRVHRRSYVRQDGSEGENIQIIIDTLYPLICRATEGGRPSGYIVPKTLYFMKGGEEQSEIITMFAGSVHSCDEPREVNGTYVANFNVEVPVPSMELYAKSTGNFNRETDYGNFRMLRCSVWGNRARNINRILQKGNTIVVTGNLTLHKGNSDRDYVNCRVRNLSVMKWADNNRRGADANSDNPPDSISDNDTDSQNVPETDNKAECDTETDTEK